MRKRRTWYRLKTIVLALLILPPLGLFLLWRSPRSRRAKIVVTLIFVLLVTGAGAAFVKSGLYGNWANPPMPASGFDVTRDRQGRYQIERVLPFERQIFNEVVREIKKLSESTNWTSEKGVNIYSADPETIAFNRIGQRHGLDPEDVGAIYMKVSSGLTGGR
jgi:hypothetical protein